MGLRLKHKQKGMILEAMLLVLSTGLMAIPSYNIYKDKAKVNEGLALASSGKVAFLEYYVSNNYQLPQGSSVQETHRELGLAEPQQIRTSSVESVSVSNDGTIRVQYQPEVFKDSSIILEPNLDNVERGNSVRWTCRAQSEYKRFLSALPPECRD